MPGHARLRPARLDTGMVHQPALVLACEAPSPSTRPLKGRPAMALMRGGTWQLMRIPAWEQAADGTWRCLLLWGVWGTVWEAWYVFDPARLIPVDEEGDPGESSAPGRGHLFSCHPEGRKITDGPGSTSGERCISIQVALKLASAGGPRGPTASVRAARVSPGPRAAAPVTYRQSRTPGLRGDPAPSLAARPGRGSGRTRAVRRPGRGPRSRPRSRNRRARHAPRGAAS